MKYLLIIWAVLFFFQESHAQPPSYYFNITTDTAIESNTRLVVGYVKTDNAPAGSDSVIVILKSGAPRPTHMDTTSRYVINFAAGQDSAPFSIIIMSDTFPEYPEHVQYVITSPANGSAIGNDSILSFVLLDTTRGAIIYFVTDSVWCYEGSDSFINGVSDPFQSTYLVGITINNPNPFYVRYIVDNIDCSSHAIYPAINACSTVDFYFNGEIVSAPPGISTYYKRAYMEMENSTSDKYFYGILRNLDANIITDSLVFFTIKHVNFFDTASLSFDQAALTVIGDSLQTVGIPITINNPNHKPMYFHIDTIQNATAYPGINYTFNNQEYGYGSGISHDTFYVSFISTHLPGDTISILFALRNDSVNSSPDTLFRLTMIDTGGLNVSFLGAGLAHLKSDSIGYVKVVTGAFAKYPISVRVSYLNGNAIRDTDFAFNDTTITFPAFTFDTIAVPVVMLQDHGYQGNTQVNLQLSNVSPSNIEYGITQYTFTIIDDEDSGLNALGVLPMPNGPLLKVQPNPFDNELSIQTALSDYRIKITNSIGEEVYSGEHQKGNIYVNLAGQAAGIYLIRVTLGDTSYIRKALKL